MTETVREQIAELEHIQPGIFLEEADLVGRLIDRGWIPPEEAKNYRKLAVDQSLPENPYFSTSKRGNKLVLNGAAQLYEKAQQTMLTPDAKGNVWVKAVASE